VAEKRRGSVVTELYESIADWWPVISPPPEYAQEAALYVDMIHAAARRPVREVLELGRGGGNNASHMKRAFDMTLIEPAEGMRRVSRKLNPECLHLPGDMRHVRLERTFDAVFVHDAVIYMRTEEDLRATLGTVASHLADGGVALVAPDATTETFSEATEHGGGEDEGERRARYLEWTLPPGRGHGAQHGHPGKRLTGCSGI
jgi:trans-aconitate methyltransferase